MFRSEKFRWLGRLLILALLLSATPLALPTHAQDNTAQTILTLLNAERNAAGLASLSLNPQLTAAAQRHSDDMAAGDFLDHVGSDGSQFWERIIEAGYPMTSGAENILYRWDTDPVGAFEQWKASPPHLANMMSTDYTEVGVAWAQSASGKYYFTMVLARREGFVPPTNTPYIIQPSPMPPTATQPPPVLPTATPFSPMPPSATQPPLVLPTATPFSPMPPSATQPSLVLPTATPFSPMPPTATQPPLVLPTATPFSPMPLTATQLPLVLPTATPFSPMPPTATQPPLALPTTTPPPLAPPAQPTISAGGTSVLERLLQVVFWLHSWTSGTTLPVATATSALPAPPTATLPPLQPPAIPTATAAPALPAPPTATLPPFQPPTVPPTIAPPIIPPTIPPPTQAPMLVPDVRIISDGQSVTVLNVAGGPLNLRPLRLQSGSGALDAVLWDNGYLSAPLNAFPAGDCLQVWGLGVAGTLPRPPQCGTRHAWLSVGPQYAFWEGVAQFQVLYGGQLVAVCQVGVPCDVSFSASAPAASVPTLVPPTVAPAQPPSGTVDVRLLYDTRGVTLLNVSGERVNLAPLVFQGTTGTLAATEWDNGYLSAPLNAFPSGDCLQAWNYGAAPLTPPVECRTRHAWLEMGTPYQFWRAGFQVFYGGQLIATCPLGAGVCDLRLP